MENSLVRISGQVFNLVKDKKYLNCWCYPACEKGYTLIELITVIVVMGILTGVAIVRFTSYTTGAIRSTAHKIITDVAYAQEIAKITNRGTSVVIIQAVTEPEEECFIATVCYSPNAAPVNVLRGFRDQALQRSREGRAFIDWYYSWGPKIAAGVDRIDLLRMTSRAILLPVVLAITPFVKDAYAAGGGDDEEFDGDPNTYSLKYQDGSFIQNAQGDDFVVELGYRTYITSSSCSVDFDGSGRSEVPGYYWSNNQTSMVFITLNNNTNIRIARHSGKVWIE